MPDGWFLVCGCRLWSGLVDSHATVHSNRLDSFHSGSIGLLSGLCRVYASMFDHCSTLSRSDKCNNSNSNNNSSNMRRRSAVDWPRLHAWSLMHVFWTLSTVWVLFSAFSLACRMFVCWLLATFWPRVSCVLVAWACWLCSRQMSDYRLCSRSFSISTVQGLRKRRQTGFQ